MKAHKTDRHSMESKLLENQFTYLPLQSCQSPKEDSDQLLQEIKVKLRAKQFSRHTRIRLQAWLTRLKKSQYSKIWNQNRNMYLKLLNLMIDCEYICHPFLSFPPRENIEILQKHQVHQIISEVQKAVKLNRVQIRKASHFADLQKTVSEISNHNDVHIPQQHSHRNVSVSNDSIRTLSVSQEIRQRLRKRSNSKSNKKIQPKFINTTIPYKIRANDLDCSFQTSKFGQPENFSDNISARMQKRNKKSNSFITEVLKDKNTMFVSEKLKKYTDSLSLNNHQVKNVKTLLPLTKTGKKQVYFKRSPRFNVLSNNWSQGGEGNQKVFTERKYWQSNSLAQVGTPRYLNFYPTQPYQSLALSSEQQEGMNTTRSKENWCSECLFKIWPSS